MEPSFSVVLCKHNLIIKLKFFYVLSHCWLYCKIYYHNLACHLTIRTKYQLTLTVMNIFFNFSRNYCEEFYRSLVLLHDLYVIISSEAPSVPTKNVCAICWLIMNKKVQFFRIYLSDHTTKIEFALNLNQTNDFYT